MCPDTRIQHWMLTLKHHQFVVTVGMFHGITFPHREQIAFTCASSPSERYITYPNEILATDMA